MAGDNCMLRIKVYYFTRINFFFNYTIDLTHSAATATSMTTDVLIPWPKGLLINRVKVNIIARPLHSPLKFENLSKSGDPRVSIHVA